MPFTGIRGTLPTLSLTALFKILLLFVKMSILSLYSMYFHFVVLTSIFIISWGSKVVFSWFLGLWQFIVVYRVTDRGMFKDHQLSVWLFGRDYWVLLPRNDSGSNIKEMGICLCQKRNDVYFRRDLMPVRVKRRELAGVPRN